MRNHKVHLLAAAALMSILPLAGAMANATLTADGRYTFSLSIEPNAVSATAVAYSIPAQVSQSAGQSSGNIFQIDSATNRRVIWNASATSTAGSYVSIGTGGSLAPYSSADAQLSGGYISLLSNSTGSTSVSARMQDPTGATSWANMQLKSASFLWGSVESTNRMEIVGSATTVITGAEVLAAAASLGFTGNNGSYYVTVNAVGANNFHTTRFFTTSPGTVFQIAPLSYDKQLTTVNAVLFPPPPVVEPPPVGAPAPVLGASPLGGLLGLGLLGFIGFGRRKVSRTTSLAA